MHARARDACDASIVKPKYVRVCVYMFVCLTGGWLVGGLDGLRLGTRKHTVLDVYALRDCYMCSIFAGIPPHSAYGIMLMAYKINREYACGCDDSPAQRRL